MEQLEVMQRILASSGMGGSLTINVSGTVIAVHGSAGGGGTKGYGANTNNSIRTGDDGGAGGAGGHAININSANITVNNLSGGQISGGGGAWSMVAEAVVVLLSD